jgi:hypothetical protein
MDHSTHEPGTVAECPQCQATAYEPSWYKALREERIAGHGPIRIPEADAEEDATVVLPDEPDIEVRLPDIEVRLPDIEVRLPDLEVRLADPEATRLDDEEH